MDNLTDTLQEIQQEMRKKSIGIKRELLSEDIPLKTDLVVAIQGVRRSGKSTFLNQLAQKNGVLKSAFFINFEDPRLSDQLNYKLLDQIVKIHETKPNSKPIYFFDEIQNVDQWEKWLHIQLEKKKRSFIITGSNSTLLDGKLGTSLTGRHLSYTVFPFSYKEFQKLKPSEDFESYLNLGGMPRSLTFENPAKLLREYFSDIIERDVRRHVAARSAQSLTQLAKAVYESAGSELSLRNLSKNFEISPETVRKYIDAFEAAYLCVSCPYFTYSERKSVVRSKKYYPIDLGLQSAIITNTGPNIGKKFETVVFYSLLKKYSKVYYWRGKNEVDFIVETSKGIQPIQVSYSQKKERHEIGVQEFLKEYPKALKPIFITNENKEEWV